MIDRSKPLSIHEFPTKLIHFEYPTLETMHDCCETPADEIERLQKTLVEERAYAIECNPNRTIEWTHEQAKERAREQLHREGKL